MIRLVLNHFRYNFKPGLKSCYNQFAEWYIYFYMLVMVPLLMREKMNEAAYYGLLIPMLVGILASRIYGGRMDKALFLCPVTVQQRKEFYLLSYWIRTLGAAFLLLLNCLLLYLFGKMTLFGAVVSLLVGLPFLFAVNVYCRPREKSSAALGRKYDLPGSYELWNVGLQIAALISVVVVASCAGERLTDLYAFDAVMLIFSVGFSLFFSFGILIKYSRPVLECSLYYEPAAKE